MDHSDAINLMFHGEATWHIFSQRDANDVECYLKSLDDDSSHTSDYSKLFSVHHYLTKVDLANLQSQFNVEPTVIQQLPGQAIIIPAGCPHQVLYI
jgi:lysine-specific demethylase 3